jgi:superfamily I DNA/RNA helicase
VTVTWPERQSSVRSCCTGSGSRDPGDRRRCVIGDSSFRTTSRVQSLTPELSKGLEFDLVVLITPETFGDGIEGAVDQYVAMTRAAQQLVILTSPCESASYFRDTP